MSTQNHIVRKLYNRDGARWVLKELSESTLQIIQSTVSKITVSKLATGQVFNFNLVVSSSCSFLESAAPVRAPGCTDSPRHKLQAPVSDWKSLSKPTALSYSTLCHDCKLQYSGSSIPPLHFNLSPHKNYFSPRVWPRTPLYFPILVTTTLRTSTAQTYPRTLGMGGTQPESPGQPEGTRIPCQ